MGSGIERRGFKGAELMGWTICSMEGALKAVADDPSHPEDERDGTFTTSNAAMEDESAPTGVSYGHASMDGGT